MTIPNALFVGINSIFLAEVDSTNVFAMDLLAKTNPCEGTCIYTDFQTAGRGQIGRYWHSSAHSNLLASFIFYPKFINPNHQFYLNIISSLAVLKVIQNYTSGATIKWPNDIYVDDNKIAGILVQNVWRGTDIKAAVIGIGLNINEVNFPESLPNPTSLLKITGQELDVIQIKDQVSASMEYYYLKLKNGDMPFLRQVYLDHLYRKGKLASFIIKDQKVDGTIMGIDDIGKIQMNIGSTLRSFDLRDISYII
jgi:BirA family biotin operon repressor/biotin-[acetyl-CoA-carboxylase] ligase